MDVLTRQHYADIVDSWIGKGNIIALVGSRRVGKSYVLKDFIQRHENDADINIIYIDKEKKDFKDIRNKDDLDALIEKSFIKRSLNSRIVSATGTRKRIPTSSLPEAIPRCSPENWPHVFPVVT